MSPSSPPPSSSPEPFLPPPPQAPPKTNSTKKTLLLWIVLVVMFIGLYYFFQPAPGQHHHPSPPSEPTNFWVSLLPMLLFAIPVAWFILWTRRSQRFNVDNARGIELLNRNQLDDAVKAFEALARKYRLHSTLVATARFNLATTRLRRGELDEAIAIMRELEAPSRIVFTNLKALSAAELALSYGLRGDVPTARTWLEEAKKRDAAAHGRPLDLMDAIIGCRAGENERVARELEEKWRAIESAHTGATLRPLRIIRAFAIVQSGDARQSGTVEPILAGARGGAPGEYAWLGQEWPELAAFMSSHGL